MDFADDITTWVHAVGQRVRRAFAQATARVNHRAAAMRAEGDARRAQAARDAVTRRTDPRGP